MRKRGRKRKNRKKQRQAEQKKNSSSRTEMKTRAFLEDMDDLGNDDVCTECHSREMLLGWLLHLLMLFYLVRLTVAARERQGSKLRLHHLHPSTLPQIRAFQETGLLYKNPSNQTKPKVAPP